MNNFKKSLLALGVMCTSLSAANAQEEVELRNKKDGDYKFQVVTNIEAGKVSNQGRSGTCWSFSSLSFFESEMERMGKDKINLSEMFVVRHTYPDKADRFVRWHGHINFGAGGAFHDVAYVIKNYGIVPEFAYSGLQNGATMHNHGEMDEVLMGIVTAVQARKRAKPTQSWKPAFEGVMDAYLGDYPSEFEYNGKKYTPKTFADEVVGLNADDYVEIGSFTHKPYYEEFELEVPDNWLHHSIQNLPLDEMIEVIDYALMNGYSIAWGADVSEKGFSFRDGLAIVPTDEIEVMAKGKDNQHFSDAGAQKYSVAFQEPVKEKVITPELRQKAYDNYETTDDHGMQLTGIVKDQNGTKYYIVKNSWGEANDCDGYFYASEAYVRYKTIDFMVHKDGIPKHLRKKMNIK
ncbi:C1 family peptidase [Sediminitomix flava]|uniref:Aminopeptidase n=1 Tax=Sediminitomix flava TaxID=379075 RepID=A0A315ZC21_SEDFL|nr:C1 family peptidase [Sediminitomix flava]PWJ42348.1 bleomycin hydrolase [Sediminitomix flava]